MVGHPGVGKTLLGSRIIVKYWGRDETRRALTLAFPEKVEPFCCGHFSPKDFPEDAFNRTLHARSPFRIEPSVLALIFILANFLGEAFQQLHLGYTISSWLLGVRAHSRTAANSP
jgi:hypothetical protein